VSATSAIQQEEAELAPAGIRIAVTFASSFVGGDTRLPSPAAGACDSYDTAETTVRACAVQAGAYRFIAGSTRIRRSPMLLGASCAVAALIAAVAAAVLGRRSARWALAPLTRLRRSLERIDADDPARVTLEGDDACREITSVRAALEGLLIRLAGALEAARGFSAEAAHELRTPLTVIRGELDLLAEEPIHPEAARSVSKLRARVRSLVVLTERLLTLATATERVDVASDAVALEDVVGEVVARLDGEKRARVRVELDSPGMVRGDETLLAALVENAIDNALKFSGATPVSVRIRDEGECVVLEVVDSGPGLRQDDRRRAFEPFFRSRDARGRSAPGHGIGLALVARIVAAHRGRAAFVDPKGGETGAHLRIELPGWTPLAKA
jgi:signal transduction histidine kinase